MPAVHPGRTSQPRLLRVLGAVVAAACLVVVGWNTASGVAVSERLQHGKVREVADAGGRQVDCFQRRVDSLIPPGSIVHLDTQAFPAIALRLTEVMYPRGVVVPDNQPAQFVVKVSIQNTPTSCDSLHLDLARLP